MRGTQFTEKVSAEGLVAVVTGSNCGIGYETAKELNLRKAKVYMLCRSKDKTNEAIKQLVEEGCEISRLIFIGCDLCNFESVRNAAKKLLEDEDHIDILINNAGIMYQPKYERTVDGHEKTWQSNHLGPFLLTELLLPAISKSNHGRIVNVSSDLHASSGEIDLTTIDDESNYEIMKSYNNSKLASVMHARALTNRLKKKGIENVTFNSLHPGVVNTTLLKNSPIFLPGIKQITAPIRCIFFKTPKDGAQTSLYCALSSKLDGISGKYFIDCAMKEENPLALDDQACEELYIYSLKETIVN